ncbi:MAG: ATP-binding protein, partial [Planctomycetaceae bacterium]|nr:ATP-binding protein [Planctomycetaceae bacterium]
YGAYEDLARRRSLQRPYIDRQLYVDISLTQQAARFSVRNEGPGFDPEAIPDPTDPEYLNRPSGRGMLLMRSFMDEVHYSEGGRQVTMMKVAPPPETDIIDNDASVFDDDDSEDIL